MPVRAERGVLIRRLATAALVPAAAFGVHELRYWLAFGSGAGAALQAQGHSYLHSLVPWIVLLAALVAGAFLQSLGKALGGECSLPRYTVSLGAMWLITSACLLAIYVSQEFLEGLFAAGHPAGVAGIFGYGGWWAIPASLAVGLVLACALHGARWVLREVARLCARQLPRRAPRAPVARAPHSLSRLRLAPLAGGWSGRGPPA
ncbi:MAG TPA: hypothetical protein VMP89_04600 [Solirubrobacteraceae bacterium]|nr:hypothetical protein [Solirubrobacteraceae bacterium]